jgi:hypothetical protein
MGILNMLALTYAMSYWSGGIWPGLSSDGVLNIARDRYRQLYPQETLDDFGVPSFHDIEPEVMQDIFEALHFDSGYVDGAERDEDDEAVVR